MLTRLRALGRDLTGRNDHHLLRHLVGQLRATLAGAELARAVARGEHEPGTAREEMVDVEHQGDEHRRELVEQLAVALAPPMDREDLFRLSRSVDDILDNLRDLVREFDLFDVDAEPLLVEPLGCIADGVTALHDAVTAIIDEPERARWHALSARKNDVRSRYQQSMARLLGGDEPVRPELLRRRELLRRVDIIGLRLGEAADALADGAIKRSH